jgi:CBS-domain-containing membrane protein
MGGAGAFFVARETAMQVSEIMTRDVQEARPDETVQEAARRMAELDVGSLPVCEGRKVIGIVTDRDIVVRGVAKGLDGRTRVSEVMSGEVETVRDSDDVDDVHDRMSAAQIRRLPVVDDRGELVGVVALADVARRERPRESGATLEEISEPRSFQGQ